MNTVNITFYSPSPSIEEQLPLDLDYSKCPITYMVNPLTDVGTVSEPNINYYDLARY
jgi:hypothetical protein